MSFKEAMIAASPALLGLGAQLEGRAPQGLAMGINQMQKAEESAKRKAAIEGLMASTGISGPEQALIAQLPVDQQAPYILDYREKRRQEEMAERIRRQAAGRAAAAEAQKRAQQQAAVDAFMSYTRPRPGAQGPTMAAANQGLSREAVARAIMDPRLTPEMRQQLVSAYEFSNPQPDIPSTVQALEYRAQAAGLQPGSEAYEQFMLTGGKQAEGLRITQGADGQWTLEQGPTAMMDGGGPVSLPTEPSRLARKVSENDAALLREAQTQAGLADNLNMNITEAERILRNGMSTGLGSGLRQQASRVGASLGLTEGEYATQFQDLDRISKAIGIDTLRAMGGNDTERELMTAIQTTVSPAKEESANMRVIANQRAASDVIAQKPNLMSAWIDQFGSLSNSNEKGQTWDTAWREYQRQEYQRLAETYSVELGLGSNSDKAAPQGVPADLWEHMTPEERELFE